MPSLIHVFFSVFGSHLHMYLHSHVLLTPFTRAQLSVKTTGPGLMTWACGLSGPVYTQIFDIPVK